RIGGANDAAQHSRYVNARDSCSSAGDRPLRSRIDMERPNFPKTLYLGQGAAICSLGNVSLTDSVEFVRSTSSKRKLRRASAKRERERGGWLHEIGRGLERVRRFGGETGQTCGV